MFYNCIQKTLKTKLNVTNEKLYFQIKIEIMQSNNYKVNNVQLFIKQHQDAKRKWKGIIECLCEASVQMVCDASEASLFAKDNSDTRQLLSALQVHRIIFKDIKNKYEDQQVTKL